MNNNPAEKIIDKIKQEHIVPESRFKLNWKSYLFWVVWIAMLLLGALFFSLTILNFLDLDTNLFRYVRLWRLFFLLTVTAPFLWIGLSVLTLVSGFLALRKTKRGYRYSLLFATSLGVLGISLLGIMLHLARINERIGQGIPTGMPGYHRFVFPIEGRWMRPEEGMLAGEVTLVQPEMFYLKSFENSEWIVIYTADTPMRIRGELEPGLRVGIMGEKIENRKFQASFIRQLPMGGQHHNGKPPCDNPPCHRMMDGRSEMMEL